VDVTVAVWVSSQTAVVHRTQQCAPRDAEPVDALIRGSECSGDYAVLPWQPWHVIGALCQCSNR
jgi:hypothetical protein